MAFRVSIGNYMMNLQSVRTTTHNASMPIALESHSPHVLPFTNVWGSFAAPPEMAFFTSVRPSFLDVGVFLTAALPFLAEFRLELFTAHGAFSYLGSTVTPSGSKVAFRSAINGFAGFFRIKGFSAMTTSFHSSCSSIRSFLLFYFFSFRLEVTRTTTKYSVSRWRGIEFFTTMLACLLNFFHVQIVAQHRLNCTYYQLAIRNLRAIEAQSKMPSLFDLMDEDQSVAA